MKNLVKTVLLTAAMAVSTNAMAYGDWFGSIGALTSDEVKNFKMKKETSVEEKLIYQFSRIEHAYDSKDIKTIEGAVKGFKLLFDEHKDARAAYGAALGLEVATKLKCKGARNYKVCVDPIDAEVVKYYEIAGFADNAGGAATDLMEYYYGRFDEAGDAHGRYWAKVGQDFVDDYYKNRPARNFKALEDQPEVKIGFFAKLGIYL
ncbi:hypothetical protein [Vibrio crassostreae]|uniref:hypothetical protein n=1 Tax=Vibrio crassostreae TaxID=246167 RepID=UPI001B318269|nr:hypothetical protein [Vibrio crassostreae]